MTTVIDQIIEKLESAREAATLENAGFGFPDDRIEIKVVHFGDESKGRAGDTIHPTAYVRRITELHHRTWIIAPIDAAIVLLKAHAYTLRDTERLVDALGKLDIDGIVSRAQAGLRT